MTICEHCGDDMERGGPVLVGHEEYVDYCPECRDPDGGVCAKCQWCGEWYDKSEYSASAIEGYDLGDCCWDCEELAVAIQDREAREEREHRREIDKLLEVQGWHR